MYQAGHDLVGEAAPLGNLDNVLWDLQSLPSVPDVLLPIGGLAPGELLHRLKLGPVRVLQVEVAELVPP